MNTTKEKLLTIGNTQNSESEIHVNGNTILTHVKDAILPLPAVLTCSLLGHDLKVLQHIQHCI
jgi:hypothetical protein